MIAQRKAAGMRSTSGAAITKNAGWHCTLAYAVEAFRAAMAGAGQEPPDTVEADGKLHRYGGGSKPCWYILHVDHYPAGIFGNWRTGQSHQWRARRECDLAPAERDAMRARIRAMQAARDAERAQRAEEAAHAAAVRWAAAVPVAGQDHQYLQTKGVRAHGLRVEGGGHTLLVPMRDAEGRLHGLQSIYPDDSKRFMPGQRVQGCYHPIGQPRARLLICEGYATGATLHEQSGDAVAVAFNAGNLLAVARALRAKYPGMGIVVCADDDWQTDGNPGLTKALEAAAAVGAKLAVPDFTGLPRGPRDTDFNDMNRLAALAGKGAA